MAELPQENIRGIWIVRHNLKTAQGIDSLIKFASNYQFTDLFVQVRGRGDAFYNSHFEPLAEGVEPNFDPLGYLLIKSHNQNYRIHAWINVFYLWSSEEAPTAKDHLFHKKPEWLVYPANYNPEAADTNYVNRRNAEGLFLSPLEEDARKHIVNVVDDILSQYPVAGLHLDYIRFPGYNFEFSPAARKYFKEKYFLDPLDLKNDPEQFVENFGRTGYDLFFSRWGEFLRNGLSEFVDSLATHVRQRYPRAIISAAVKPDLHKAHWRFYQDWGRWLKKGWLDWAIPMNYTKENDLFFHRIQNMLKSNDPARLLMGISLYNQSADSALEKITSIEKMALEQNSLGGFVLFSYDQIVKEKRLQRLYMNKILKAGVRQ